MKKSLSFFLLFIIAFCFSGSMFKVIIPYRVFPYLQVYDQGKIQITWISNTLTSSDIQIKDPSGSVIFEANVTGQSMPEVFYSDLEKNQVIAGLEKGSWLQPEQAFRYQVQVVLPPGIDVTYRVSLGGFYYQSNFKSPKDKNDWEKIRFIALADSETEPRGRVTHREWYPGVPLFRPFTIPQLWKDKFGFTTLEGFEIPNYMLTEEQGYAENLKIINARNIDFMVMPGDLVQGGGYQPGWDEFFRHNAGDLDQGFSKYPVIPSFGNWENFGALNGGYGDTPGGEFAPVVSRKRYQAYFKTPVTDPLQKHGQSYYRSDYGPITILTIDSSNGTPDQLASDFEGITKLKGKEFTVPGTDTQENYTDATYKARGGNDLSGFGPGSDQYAWLEANLKDANESGQLIFVQFHHIAFGSGEHSVPLNHDLSVGQTGTPMRVLNPLFEQYEVIAVLSGHDEIFERSFVDEDNDGKGVMYYDVGVAGDGIRSVKRDWKDNPLATLDYNPYSKWTADQNSVEQWDTSGAVPILTDGGKHYGHLEVNLEKIQEGGETFAKINFTPVYVFPVLDQNYNLLRVERRIYNDEVELKVLLKQLSDVPQIKDSVSIYLNQEGNVVLTPDDFLKEQPAVPFTYTSSVGFDFTCDHIGVNPVAITSKNTATGEEWMETIQVWVLDTIPPSFDAANAILLFDPSVGTVSISIADFSIVDFYDNCSDVVTISASRFEVTCSDIYQNPDAPQWEFPIVLTATDPSGNTYSKTVKANVGNIIESKKVSISSTGPFEGGTTKLILGDELDYTVLNWEPDFNIVNQSGNEATISQNGWYRARVMLATGCPVYSINFAIGELVNDYNQDLVLYLDESGKAELSVADVLKTDAPEIVAITTLSQLQFSCEDLGTIDLKVTRTYGSDGNDMTNAVTYDDWIKVTVRDNKPPILTTKTPSLTFDLIAGVLELSPEDFVESVADNCSEVDLSLNKASITCADYDSPLELILTATDQQGNSYSEQVEVDISVIESKKVSITPSGVLQATNGEPVELILGEEFAFQLASWIKDGAEIAGGNEKAILVTESGSYWAEILTEGGCSVLTEKVTITFNDLPYDTVKEVVELSLNESGEAVLKPENLFDSASTIDPNLAFEFSQFEFTCADLGEKQVTIIIKNQSGEMWEEVTLVKVKDNLKPVILSKNLTVALDVTLGSLALTSEEFISELTDNCAVKEVTINKNTVTCEDLGKEIVVEIRAVDASGNVTEKTALLTVTSKNTAPVTITGSEEFCAGEVSELTLTSTASFEVIRWRRNGVELVNQKSKVLTIEEGGNYDAVIRYEGACLSETVKFEVKLSPLPSGTIQLDGNKLIAPAGDYTYQWYRNENLISGATERVFNLVETGNYTVELTSSAGCTAKLAAVEITISGLIRQNPILSEELKIYPNPASDLVSLEVKSDLAVRLSNLKVYSFEGKDVTGIISIQKESAVSYQLEITSLAAGSYLVLLESEDRNVFIGKFVKK